jgi:hypothetical protein
VDRDKHFTCSVSSVQFGGKEAAGLQQERKTRQEIANQIDPNCPNQTLCPLFDPFAITVAQTEAKGVQEKVLKVRRKRMHCKIRRD